MFPPVDARSVAFFRITLGASLLAFDWRWLSDYAEFWAPEGLGVGGGGLAWFLIFWTVPLLAVFLIVGFSGRLASALSLVAVCLVQQAAPEILQGGDQLLRLLLFWSILFLSTLTCPSIGG